MYGYNGLSHGSIIRGRKYVRSKNNAQAAWTGCRKLFHKIITYLDKKKRFWKAGKMEMNKYNTGKYKAVTEKLNNQLQKLNLDQPES